MEDIQLTESEIPEFEKFLQSPGVEVLFKKESENHILYVCNTNQRFRLPKSNSRDNELIFGKDNTPGIVSVEVDGSNLIVFRQESDGSVVADYKPFRYWFLTNKKALETAQRLEGDQHYKWINYVDSEEEYSDLNLYKLEAHKVNDKKEMALIKSGATYFKGLKHNEVSVLSFDLETNGVELNDKSFILLIANTFRNSKGVVERKMFSYDEYKNQGAMLEAWCQWVNEKDPSIICGHNVYTFDLPFLNHVAELYNISLNIGRDKSDIRFNEYESKFRKDGSQFIHYKKAFIFGREILDTMFLSIKYDVARNFENYKLKSIINHLGLQKENRQFYDASKIRENYTDPEEFKKIKAYAEADGDDSLALYDIMAPSFFYWSQKVPKPFQSIIEGATGSQLNSLLVRSYLQNNKSIPKASEVQQFEGAISDATPGIWKNVIKWDISSLYPSIILQYDVYDKYKDPEGNFLKMVKILREERLKHKKLAKATNDPYYSALEQSEKIGINSAYGMLGAPGLNFNSSSKASFITMKGREILVKGIEWATGKQYKTPNEIKNES